MIYEEHGQSCRQIEKKIINDLWIWIFENGIKMREKKHHDSPKFQSSILLSTNGNIVSKENWIGSNGGIFQRNVAKCVGKHVQARCPSYWEVRFHLSAEMLLLRNLQWHAASHFYWRLGRDLRHEEVHGEVETGKRIVGYWSDGRRESTLHQVSIVPVAGKTTKRQVKENVLIVLKILKCFKVQV